MTQNKEIPEIFSKKEIATLERYFRTRKYPNPHNQFSKYEVKLVSLRDYLLFLISYVLALRPNEACCIKIPDIDFQKNTIYIAAEGNKVKKARIMLLAEVLKKPIIKYLMLLAKVRQEGRAWKQSLYLFPTKESLHISRDRWTEIFRKALIESGIYKVAKRGQHGHFSPYTLRHTKATELYEKFRSEHFVAKFLGHKGTDCVGIYVHLFDYQNKLLDYMRLALNKNSLINSYGT